MEFDTIVQTVAERASLTSDAAIERIGRNVNERYRWLASSLGLSTIQRKTTTARTKIGNRSVIFGSQLVGVEKVLSVYNATYTPVLVLGESTFDELRNQLSTADPATQYAIQLMGVRTVTIYLNSIPTSVYTLTADVLSNVQDMATNDEPAFAEDFHDILIYGALETEYIRMEKTDLAARAEARYEQRLSDLRFYIAKSAYLQRFQNKTGGLRPRPLMV